jgi:membrane-bound serine protease (ClpP class)
MKKILFLALLLALPLVNIFGQTNNVLVLTLDGAINPSAADYIHYGIKQAEKDNSQCVVIKLNTPGGLLESTRKIVSDILESKVPVVVYVSPAGSRAASAGVFITLSANIAAMAPGTNIGAAHPVSLQGQMDSTMVVKVTNDAAAFIRTISQKRNRNVQWAEEAVRKSISITETEAVNEHVVDLVAKNLTDLLYKINGREASTENGTITLHTEDAQITYVNMNFQQDLLSILSDPNIAYVLFMLGVFGLLFELYNPGLIFPGVIGVISLIIAFYSMYTLPINYAGLALIIFGIILFVLEIKIVSHGILTIGGIVSLVIGSLMLITPNSALEVVYISWQVIAAVAVLTFLFFFFIIGFGIRAQKLKTKTGAEGIVNEIGTALTELNPDGQVRVHGEIWKAVSLSGKIEAGTKVAVVEISNLKLKIRRVDS